MTNYHDYSTPSFDPTQKQSLNTHQQSPSGSKLGLLVALGAIAFLFLGILTLSDTNKNVDIGPHQSTLSDSSGVIGSEPRS